MSTSTYLLTIFPSFMSDKFCLPQQTFFWRFLRVLQTGQLLIGKVSGQSFHGQLTVAILTEYLMNIIDKYLGLYTRLCNHVVLTYSRGKS